jgi:hypothetical protein
VIVVVGVPRFHVQVDMATVDALAELARCHYDAACKNTSLREDGVLNRWRRHLELEVDMPVEPDLANEPVKKRAYAWPTASFRELDTLSKVTEMAGPVFVAQREKLSLVTQFYMQIARAVAQYQRGCDWTLEVP